MINGLGVVGWGVGGIEAEACMLGQPIYMVTPQVVGFKLHGKLPEGATATDLVLVITQILRGARRGRKVRRVLRRRAWRRMTVADRATIANMAPEYGATMGFFPVDEQTLDVSAPDRPRCRITSIWSSAIARSRACGGTSTSEPKFSEVLELGSGHGEAEPRRAQASAGSR